jgi:hypothetical protein
MKTRSDHQRHPELHLLAAAALGQRQVLVIEVEKSIDGSRGPQNGTRIKTTGSNGSEST